ncbi:hypothetical protein EVAR_98248_1 [Eumeta japonica]|uniref:Uncharacterized protein n=1 Tax=Eumeta variegata TaxID=151549 RepID=A0A4C1XZV6_EUMVA|nr:hypothetical protein EVAR_98248_1 [Eumeta japonica]
MSMRATKKQVVTATHGDSQSQRSHGDGLLRSENFAGRSRARGGASRNLSSHQGVPRLYGEQLLLKESAIAIGAARECARVFEAPVHRRGEDHYKGLVDKNLSPRDEGYALDETVPFSNIDATRRALKTHSCLGRHARTAGIAPSLHDRYRSRTALVVFMGV